LAYAETPPPWDGGVADRLETRCSPTCVIVPSFVALGQTVWAYVWVSEKFADAEARLLWTGASLTPRNAQLPHLFYRANFGHVKVKLYERNYGDPPENFDPSHAAFQGYL